MQRQRSICYSLLSTRSPKRNGPSRTRAVPPSIQGKRREELRCLEAVERLLDLCRHRLRGVADDLLGELLELADLGRHRVELLASIGGLQLNHLGEGLRPEQVAGKRERGVAVGLHRIKGLDAEIEYALACSFVSILDHVGGVLGS